MGSTCVLPVELHASIWEHSERAGHLQGGLHGARHRYGSIGTIKASTPYEVRWGYCTVPSVRGPLCVEFRDNFQLLVSNLNRGQERDIHARTGPDTQRAQAHNHTQNSNSRTHPRQTSRSHAHTHLPNGERCPSTDDTAPHHSHTHSATPTRERARQWNHRLRELHRPLRQRLRPLPPLPLHLPLPPNLVELEAGEARELRLTVSVPQLLVCPGSARCLFTVKRHRVKRHRGEPGLW